MNVYFLLWVKIGISTCCFSMSEACDRLTSFLTYLWPHLTVKLLSSPLCRTLISPRWAHSDGEATHVQNVGFETGFGLSQGRRGAGFQGWSLFLCSNRPIPTKIWKRKVVSLETKAKGHFWGADPHLVLFGSFQILASLSTISSISGVVLRLMEIVKGIDVLSIEEALTPETCTRGSTNQILSIELEKFCVIISQKNIPGPSKFESHRWSKRASFVPQLTKIWNNVHHSSDTVCDSKMNLPLNRIEDRAFPCLWRRAWKFQDCKGKSLSTCHDWTILQATTLYV